MLDLARTGPGPDYLIRETMRYAKQYPRDPRVPEALHYALRSQRYGCAGIIQQRSPRRHGVICGGNILRIYGRAGRTTSSSRTMYLVPAINWRDEIGNENPPCCLSEHKSPACGLHLEFPFDARQPLLRRVVHSCSISRGMTKLLSLMLLALVPLSAAEKGFTSLFNGKDLTGWKVNEHTDTFSIKDGAIVAHGPRSHCFYTGDFHDHNFKDFELKVDVMTLPGSNGGIYIQTEYQPEAGRVRGSRFR